MRKRLITTITAVVALVVVFSITVYSKNRNEVKLIKTAVAKKGSIESYLSTTATIKSKNVREYFGLQFKIDNVRIKIGDSITSGQNLISYDLTDLTTQVKQAELQYENAVLQKMDLVNQRDSINLKISELDRKITDAENTTDLNLKSGVPAMRQQRSSLQPVSEVKLQQADNAISLAKTTLDAANSKLNSVKEGIVSKSEGTVTVLNAVEGAVPNPSQLLIKVQDLNNLKAVVSLGKFDSEKISIGQEAVLKSGGKSYKGKVAFLSPAATKAVSSVGGETSLEAEIDIEDKPINLKVDFDADVDILLANKSNVIKVPVEAIKSDKYGNNYLFINSSGIAKSRNVKTGIKSDTEVEITEGVKEGEKVILNPSTSISDGTKVKDNT